ncbi:MAG: diguanylate cyclase domain-containing protein [bacterium]
MNGSDLVLSVLFYDTSSEDADLVQQYLNEIESGWSVNFRAVEDMEAFNETLESEDFHVVILKDNLAESGEGLNLVSNLRSSGYSRPVVLVAENGSEQLAAESFRTGVDDYLVKEDLTPGELKRCIEYVLNQFFYSDGDDTTKDQLFLRERRDSLTGFYNRLSLVNQLDDLYPSKQNLVLFLSGITNLERVNESHGQEVGDSVIKQFGEEIEGAFEEELVARVQGGDFCVVVKGKGPGYTRDKAESLLEELHRNRLEFDRRNNTPLNFVGCNIQKSNETPDGESLLQRGIDRLHKVKAGESEERIEIS